MGLTINTNISSIRTNRALEATQKELARSVQRISSGVRLNSAKDDPAGLATVDRLSVQIRSISMVIRNANDGISVAQTAEGGLQEITGMLQRIQELAVQASNPSNTTLTRTSLQSEVTQLNAEITRISEQTEFNGQKILTGSLVNVNFQVGTQPDEVIGLSIPETSSTNLGNFSAVTDNIGDFSMGAANVDGAVGEAPGNRVVNQVLTLRGFNTQSAVPDIRVDAEETAASIAQKINDIEEKTGVKATTKTTLTLEGVYDESLSGTQNISFRLYGTNRKEIGSTENAAFVAASITDVSEIGFRSLISKINEQKNVSGITAAYTGRGEITLTHGTGENISLEAFSNTSKAETPNSPPNELVVKGAPGTTQETLIEGTVDSVTVGGVITLNSPKPFSVTSSISAEDGSLFKNTRADEPQASTFQALFKIDLTTLEGAGRAIEVASNALEQISAFRSELGAIQNRFETAISNLQSIQEQTQNARSRIMDTDYADEVSRFTRAQIFQQAGVAILAQSNATPFAVLELLRT